MASESRTATPSGMKIDTHGRPSCNFPRIEDRHLGIFEIADISGNHGQIVVKRGCGDQRINGRHRLALTL